jgi:hypothetical protein
MVRNCTKAVARLKNPKRMLPRKNTFTIRKWSYYYVVLPVQCRVLLLKEYTMQVMGAGTYTTSFTVVLGVQVLNKFIQVEGVFVAPYLHTVERWSILPGTVLQVPL